MKNFFNLFVVAAFLVSASLALAAGPGTPVTKPLAQKPMTTVNCCVKGKCTKLGSAADCAKVGGKVVQDCKDCGSK